MGKEFINTKILCFPGKMQLSHSLTRSIIFSRNSPFRRHAVALPFTHRKWNTGDYTAKEIIALSQMRDVQGGIVSS